ncbi:MAG: hypothetical protein KC419_03855 [Anaerolineales bacterium]|nr:hypothetical protein [Anaerolineales bacterium]
MKLHELAAQIKIDPRKLTEYALNPQSLRGRHKAIIFEHRLGYTLENYQLLLQQMQTLAPLAEVSLHSEDEFGKRYTADLQIEGVTERRAIVRTGWFLPMESDEIRLATLWVYKEIENDTET